MSGPRLDAALSAMKQLKVASLHAAEIFSWRALALQARALAPTIPFFALAF